jgi:protein required for attachment to host cells
MSLEPIMANIWIVAANRSKARIFEMQKPHGPLVEVMDLADPKGRARDRDINSDAYGRLYGKGERAQGHSTSGDVSPMQHESERFAERLRDRLDRAHAERRFDRLWIVAPPAFLGVLREKLGKQLRGMIELEVNKDVPDHSPDEIRDAALAARARQAERDERLQR